MASSDLILYAGGEVYETYGSLSKKTSIEEDIAETFTRASTAYYVDRAGILRIAEVNALRTEWTGSAFDTPALLLEDARTNGWTYSEDFGDAGDAAWTKIRSSITDNATTAPDGNTTADKLVEDGTAANTHVLERLYAGATDNTIQSVSFYAKAAGRDWVEFLAGAKGGTFTRAYFDVTNGVVGQTANVDGTPTITALADGWFLCSVSWDATAGGSSTVFNLRLADSDGGEVYDGDGSSGMYLWGLQYENDKSFSSSYIKTVAGTVTRALEVLTLPFPFKPQEMTVYCKFEERGTFKVGGAVLLQISNAAGDTARLVIRTTGSAYRVTHTSAAGASDSILAAGPTIGDLVELRVTLSSAGVAQSHQSINGAAETSASAGTAKALDASWSGSLVHVNSIDSSAVGLNKFRSIKIARGTQTMAEMRALGV